MATVYLAEDLRHGRQVAVKVLRPELAAVLGAERFVPGDQDHRQSPTPNDVKWLVSSSSTTFSRS
jgi:hypothetical protein